MKSVCWRTEPGDILGSFHRGKVFVVRFSTCFPANLTDCPFKSIRDDVGSKTAGCAYVGSAETSFQTRALCSVVHTDVNFYEHWLVSCLLISMPLQTCINVGSYMDIRIAIEDNFDNNFFGSKWIQPNY